jgi:hypothetical protein
VLGEQPSPDSLQVFVHFDRVSGEYRADLEFRGAKPGQRSLRDRGDSCEPLEGAVAVAISLLLDGEIERRERAVVDVPRTASTISIVAAEVEPSPTKTTPWYGSVEGGPQWGFGGRATTWIGASLGVRPKPGWLLESSAIAWPPSTTKYDTGEVTVSLLAGALRACRLWGDRWRLGPCAAAALGRLHGVGRGFDESMSTTLLWSALGTSLSLERPLGERWVLGLQGTAWLPLFEQTLSVENVGTAWRPAVAWLGFGARLGVRFR